MFLSHLYLPQGLPYVTDVSWVVAFFAVVVVAVVAIVVLYHFHLLPLVDCCGIWDGHFIVGDMLLQF